MGSYDAVVWSIDIGCINQRERNVGPTLCVDEMLVFPCLSTALACSIQQMAPSYRHAPHGNQTDTSFGSLPPDNKIYKCSKRADKTIKYSLMWGQWVYHKQRNCIIFGIDDHCMILHNFQQIGQRYEVQHYGGWSLKLTMITVSCFINRLACIPGLSPREKCFFRFWQSLIKEV